MPACSKPNNDIVTPPRQPSVSDVLGDRARSSPTPKMTTRPSAPSVPTLDVASLRTSGAAREAIRELENLRSKTGVDSTKVDAQLKRLRSRLAELEQDESTAQRLDPLFVDVPEGVPIAPDALDTAELAAWALGATSNEIGALAERAAERWAEAHLGMQGGTDAHHINAHGIDHVLVDRDGNLFIAETKGTAGVGKTEQSRYLADRPAGPATLLRSGQLSDSWVEKDAWMREQGLTADALAEKLFFRVDVTSQTIDVYGQDETGLLSRHVGGPFHCRTVDLLRMMRDDAAPLT